jgi:hypothetical protein
MEQQLISVMVGALLTLAITAISTWLTRKRFYAEKWWERKAKAYSKIIEALHHAANCNAQWSDADLTKEEFSEDRKKQLLEDFRAAQREIEKSTGIGAYIISAGAAEVLAELAGRPDNFDYQRDPWFEMYSAESKAYKAALEKIRNLAKEDLEVA